MNIHFRSVQSLVPTRGPMDFLAPAHAVMPDLPPPHPTKPSHRSHCTLLLPPPRRAQDNSAAAASLCFPVDASYGHSHTPPCYSTVRRQARHMLPALARASPRSNLLHLEVINLTHPFSFKFFLQSVLMFPPLIRTRRLQWVWW
jgi:hypothetical protein